MKRHFIGKIKLTSVKILEDRYNKFKEFNINRPMTLQRLVNRSLVMYLNDPEFRKQVDDMNQLIVSGSSL
jgi:hypothetical protein